MKITRYDISPSFRPLLFPKLLLIISTEQTSIYLSTFPNALTSIKAQNKETSCTFFSKHDRSLLSPTSITLKFKMSWFPK